MILISKITGSKVIRDLNFQLKSNYTKLSFKISIKLVYTAQKMQLMFLWFN